MVPEPVHTCPCVQLPAEEMLSGSQKAGLVLAVTCAGERDRCPGPIPEPASHHPSLGGAATWLVPPPLATLGPS